jgi:hypothetical protein
VVALSVLGVLALLAAGLLALSGVTRHFTADGVERIEHDEHAWQEAKEALH